MPLSRARTRRARSRVNKSARAGWYDVALSEKGHAEAAEGGRLLEAEGFRFDVAYTSTLKRAIRTLWLALEELDQVWLPVRRDWRLNERHYGALQGLNKAETAEKHGEDQVLIWRRSYDVPPPPMGRHSGRARAVGVLVAGRPRIPCPPAGPGKQSGRRAN